MEVKTRLSPRHQGEARRGYYLASNMVPTTATRIDPSAIPPTNIHASLMLSYLLSFLLW